MDESCHSLARIEKTAGIINKAGARLYFIGIGGVSMSALALLCKANGAEICGSDASRSCTTELLSKQQIEVHVGHRAENIAAFLPDAVIFSLAISQDNPEMKEAIRLGIPLIRRSELLGAHLAAYDTSVCVSGSHGKSTTVAMLTSIFSEAGLSPTALCGADLINGLGVLFGSREYIIAEACEYGGSFLDMHASLSVMLNLELDHTDCYRTLDEIKSAFIAAANASERVLINADDQALLSIIPHISARTVTVSSHLGTDYTYIPCEYAPGRWRLILLRGNDEIVRCELAVPGRYNLANAAMAAAAADLCGVSAGAVGRALSSFGGIGRRLELLRRVGETDVYYDYAHHPSEIAAVYSALSSLGYGKICTVFSPHTYSRTEAFFSEFQKELSRFDKVFLTEIYAAREPYRDTVSATLLGAAINASGGNCSPATASAVINYINEEKPSCIVLMGAGELREIKQAIEDF